MDGRKRLSGAAYRRIAEEKKQREDYALKKVRKIDAFFSCDKTVKQTSHESNSDVSDSYSETCKPTNDSDPVNCHINLCRTSEGTDTVVSSNETCRPTEDTVTDDSNFKTCRPTEETVDKICRATEDSDPVKTNNSKTFTHDTDTDYEINTTTQDPSTSDAIKNDCKGPTNDPYNWVINDKTIDFLLKQGIKQNDDSDFSNSAHLYNDGRKRHCTYSLFKRKLQNGNIVKRDYLVYSQSQGSLYCAPCMLFEGQSGFASKLGFNDWIHAAQRISEHENSFSHRDCVIKLKTRANELSRIDKQLVTVFEQEVQYWRNVLQRVVSVLKKLSSRGLAFRGDDEVFGSEHNGNFMMCLELIAEYDPFLSAHIARYGNPGSGKTSYLSPVVCNELIKIMGDKVVSNIVEDVKMCKYYSVIVDSSPDITHNDQLAFIVRYVNEKGKANERFITFLKNPGHTGENLADAVLKTLKSFDLEISDCRGQTYDNGSNMSGKYSGLQARLKAINPLAFYIPCAAHSANLSGSRAAECCRESSAFFIFLQSLFNFFSSSTQRWNLLTSFFGPQSSTLKSLSQTRWSAREDACRSLNINWKAVFNALKLFSDDDTQKCLDRNRAKGLLKQLSQFETAFMSSVWGAIFEQFGKTMSKLQSEDMDVSTAKKLYESLIGYLETIKCLYDEHKSKAIKKINDIKTMTLTLLESSDLNMTSPTSGTSPAKRIRKRKRFYDESDSDPSSDGDGNLPSSSSRPNDNKLKSIFLVVIDTLKEDLENRLSVYTSFASRFDFISKLADLEATKIMTSAKELCELYNMDLDESLINECIHLKSFTENTKNVVITKTGEKVEKPWTLPSLNVMLVEKKLQEVYPNVCVALKMYNCTAATNCSAERSFSVLRRVKNYMRSTQGQERLVSAAVLCIESDITNSLTFDGIIDDFAYRQARRKPLLK